MNTSFDRILIPAWPDARPEIGECLNNNGLSRFCRAEILVPVLIASPVWGAPSAGLLFWRLNE
jgi:hypothetical protein